ncbi:hypothetical protein [Microcoleus sp. bin38.metabat.b11b12b14.051]|uniref:hypothetical protein n=1 Tax=Microcoleus sp. bin38.metabat.b11b12b14.051 TaxID=2742709 RepID=UPI0025EE3D78|nr:hypothetical protein [Microcoleus sp. bin38.metabat.b11b12b14.051]
MLALIATIERKISGCEHLPRGGSFCKGDRTSALSVGRGFFEGRRKKEEGRRKKPIKI